MARINGEIVIDRPLEVVFDFVSDERNEPRYNPQMLSVEKLSPGPIGSGTQFRAQMKSGSRTLPLLLELTTFERPVRLGSHSTFSGVTIDGELRAYPDWSARTDAPVDTSRMRPLPGSQVAGLRGSRLVTAPPGPRTPRTHIPTGIGPYLRGRRTALNHLKRFAELGLVAQRGAARSTYYEAQR